MGLPESNMRHSPFGQRVHSRIPSKYHLWHLWTSKVELFFMFFQFPQSYVMFISVFYLNQHNFLSAGCSVRSDDNFRQISCSLNIIRLQYDIIQLFKMLFLGNLTINLKHSLKGK